MKISIKNFQSIKKANLEIPTGITCICGESNQGKTAIFRAIKALLLNPNGSSHYVKHGESKAEVTLENNGELLTWERTKSTTTYKYKGETYTKASKQNSMDFCNLGFVIDSKGKLINLSDEWSVLFPFSYSDTELFKLFEDLFSITDTAKIIDGIKGDETSCNRDKLLTQDKLKAIIEKKEKLESLSSQLGNPDQPKMIKSVLTMKQNNLDKLRKDYREVESLNRISKLEIDSKPFKADLITNTIKDIENIRKAYSWVRKVPVNLSIPKSETFDFNSEDLRKLTNALSEYMNEVNKNETLTNSTIDLEKFKSDLESKFKSIDICPLCGNKMEKE